MFFFLPLGTTRPCWRTPYYLYGLIALNGVVFLVQLADPELLPPGFVPGQPTLAGALASAFMHVGIMHLAGNMLFLWLFGSLTEDVFGPRLMLGVYFASHLGALALDALISVAFSPSDLATPCVGASGAIAGIMGLAAVCFLQTKVRVWYFVTFYFRVRAGTTEIAAPVFVGLWVAWELLQGLLSTGLDVPSDTAHWAHIGGFAVGLAAALALRLRHRVVYTDLVGGRRPLTSRTEGYAQMADLKRIVEKQPQDGEAWYSLGRAREVSGLSGDAAEAYRRAVEIFLRERRTAQVAKAYAGLKEHAGLFSLPGPLLFPLALALEREGRMADAFEVFRRVATVAPDSPEADTALIRAGDIARGLPRRRKLAEQCYQALLRDYPDSRWRGRAMMGLREMETAPSPGEEVSEEPEDEGRESGSRFDHLERYPTDRGQRPE